MSEESWISVEDRLPKENTEVIGVDRSGVFWIAEQETGFWNNDTKSHWIINITHWKPLPPPPVVMKDKA